MKQTQKEKLIALHFYLFKNCESLNQAIFEIHIDYHKHAHNHTYDYVRRQMILAKKLIESQV